MAIYKQKNKTRKFHVHAELLRDCSSFFADALNGPHDGPETKVVIVDDDEWVLELFHNWLYFRTMKFPSAEEVYEEEDDDEDSSSTQDEIVQLLHFAGQYKVPQLYKSAVSELCYHLSQGQGVEENAIFYAQRHLEEDSPINELLAEAYARSGLADCDDWAFYRDLKPFFMRLVLISMDDVRHERERKKYRELPTPTFKVARLLPAKKKDDDIEMDEAKQTGDTANGAQGKE